MREFLGNLTPSQRRLLAVAIATASIVGGFVVAGNDPSLTDASADRIIRTEETTTVAQATKESFSVKVDNSTSNEVSSSSITVHRSVITED